MKLHLKRQALALASCVLLPLLPSCDGGSSDPTSISSTSGSSNATTAPETVVDGVTVDPLLQPYLDSFIVEANLRGISTDGISSISIVFDELDDSIAGLCIPDSETILINDYYQSDSTNLEELVFHELGHCFLGMEHRPDSIMQAVSFIGITEATLDEFFDPTFFNVIHDASTHAKYF